MVRDILLIRGPPLVRDTTPLRRDSLLIHGIASDHGIRWAVLENREDEDTCGRTCPGKGGCFGKCSICDIEQMTCVSAD